MILLETLPGWPAAPEQSTVQMIMLMIVLPLVAAAIITALVLGPKYFRR